MNNEEYITEYIESRGLSKKTQQSITVILNHYSKFQQSTLHELLIEADTEEEQGIRWKRRTLKQRLTRYQNHLRKTMTINSAKTYFRTVKTFYTHNEIEIGILPVINSKQAKTNNPISYKDLPTREIIKKAISISNPLMKALILFLSSSGMSKADALQLSIQSFIEATSNYHHKSDRISSISTLQQQVEAGIDIIPAWHCRRQKTNKYFVTFSSSESSVAILEYLQIRIQKESDLSLDNALFKIHPNHFTVKFEEINSALNLGNIGSYGRFRGHMLRKFHSSTLAKDGMDRYLINVLQGKSNGKVDDVYFFEDEDRLREEYLKHMHSLLIFSEANEIRKEYDELKAENDNLRKQLVEIQEMKKEIDKLKKLFE